MVKIRLKRVKVGNYFVPGELDKRFAEGRLEAMPKKGNNLVFYFGRLGPDWWMTTSVTKITRLKTVISVKTRNSTYHIKKGWK